MKIPYIVGGVVVVLVAAAAVAYVELRPASVAIMAPPPAAPAPASPAAPSQALLAAPPATSTADCLLPGPPPVAPDGGKATADDMKLAHDVTQAFVVQLEGYQSCREKQVTAAGPNVTDQQKQAWRERGNAAVDEANALAGRFAAQLKIYHIKHPAPLAQTPTK